MKQLGLLGVAAGIALSSPGIAAAQAPGDSGACRFVEIDLVPTAGLQMVVWLEDAAGQYVDTLFITRLTGSFGLGNRPGMMEFNSGPLWPYGRRTTTFPVWAHSHGMEWPLVVYQDADDDDLSHPLAHSSREMFYCRPLLETEPMWDTQTCASTVYTDKGVLSDAETSRYPPRADLDYVEGTDHPSTVLYPELNPFDQVSAATPPGGAPFRISWAIPPELPDGDYVVRVEVSKEFDQNQFYDYPSPVGIPWSEYGVAYRGQPSVLYDVPIAIAAGETVARADGYAGYGDPDGLDGDVREPDNTISTATPGSGAARLQLTADATGEMYRVKVTARRSDDDDLPGQPQDPRAVDVTAGSATIEFVAPGDDGAVGRVSGYEVRTFVGDVAVTADNFLDGRPGAVSATPVDPGDLQLLTVAELAPRTRYTIAVRAFDECRNAGDIQVVTVTTPAPLPGAVDWCFVATAAYGSRMHGDVTLLRRFRDRFLRTHATGELLVETYYTFGPALARLIGPSDTLRRLARAGLGPVVDAVRDLSPGR